MKPTTHQEVRALLQAAADRLLIPDERLVLDAHLGTCSECRSYAQSLDELEAGLRRVMRQQWNIRQTPLQPSAIRQRSSTLMLQNQLAGMLGRFAVIPVLALAFVMAVGMVIPPQIAVNISRAGAPGLSFHTPTPATHLTATKALALACANVTLLVQQDDTLDSIATRYNISREAIREYNGLASERLIANTRLVIPLCAQTLQGTTTTPTVTITIAPQGAALSPSPTG